MSQPVAQVNVVALLASALGIGAVAGIGVVRPGWLLLKPNRIVEGIPVDAFESSASLSMLVLLCWVLLLPAAVLRLPYRAGVLAALVTVAFVSAILLVGQGASELSTDESPSARVSMLGGVWITLLACYVGFYAALNEAHSSPAGKAILVLPALAAGVFLLGNGTLNELGLWRELGSQQGNFRAELARHMALATASVLTAGCIGLPLAIRAARSRRLAAFVLPAVGLMQTVPSLALFGLLLLPLSLLGNVMRVSDAMAFITLGLILPGGLWFMLRRAALPDRLLTILAVTLTLLVLLPLTLLVVLMAVLLEALLSSLISAGTTGIGAFPALTDPLSELGVRGIGTAPAIIALTLYALLPIMRNTFIGIREVPAPVTEAARGMGMNQRQILWQVQLPLALPLIVEGLRASAVLTIGIATVAYLIGAGGLGTFIQQGIDQVVPDLILLGALPVIMLALIADAVLRGMGSLLRSPRLRLRCRTLPGK